MSRRDRQHTTLTKMLRLLMLAWLGLSVMVQPALASLAELHEASHGEDVRAGHGHLAESSPDHESPTSPDQEFPKHLHDLLHLAHCCGHPTAVVMPALALPAFVAMPIAAAPRVGAVEHDVHTGTPFRPPITA